MSVSIVAVETVMPEKIVTNEFFGDIDDDNPMFRGTKERRHCETDATNSDYLAAASRKILEKYNLDASDIGIFMSNVTHLDIPFTGNGATWAYRLGVNPRHIYDIHNTGCTSFVYMIELAQTLMEALDIQYAFIGNVQLAAGKLFAQEQNRNKPQSIVPGDGCAVALLERNSAASYVGTVREIATATHGEFSEDMFITRPDGREWWEPSEAMAILEFSHERIFKILKRGNRVVPERIKEVCEKAGMQVTDIDFLITNQPNPVFLRNWREYCQLPEERTMQTFEQFGNLFGVGQPANLSFALEQGRIQKGDLVCIAGFSHAGDYSAAVLVQY